MSTRTRFPLGLKTSAALVLAVTISLAVAYFLVGQLGKTAANVAASDAALRIDAMEEAITHYHELVNVTKRLHTEIAERLAKRPEIATLDPAADLASMVRDPDQASLRALALLRADGSVVTGFTTFSGGGTAYRWTDGSGLVSIGDLPGGAHGSQGYDVSADGDVIVGYGGTASSILAFRWTSSGMVSLGELPGGAVQSTAVGISGDGNVVVGHSQSTAGTEAFRWTSGGGIAGIGDLAGGAFS